MPRRPAAGLLDIPGRLSVMRTKDPKLQALKSIQIVSDLPTRQLRRLVGLVDEVTVEAGTVLIHQGQLNRHAYLIQAGSVDVTVQGERVAVVGAGSIVGERTAVGEGVANATVAAAETTTILAIDHRALRGTAADDEVFGAVLRDLAAGRSNEAA